MNTLENILTPIRVSAQLKCDEREQEHDHRYHGNFTKFLLVSEKTLSALVSKNLHFKETLRTFNLQETGHRWFEKVLQTKDRNTV